MRSITTLTSSLLLAAGVLAQYGSGSDSGYGVGSGDSGSDFTANVSPTSPPAPIASSSPTAASGSPAGKVHVHTVKVSNKKGELTFTPSTLKAAKGSLVQFQFYPKKHSIVESTFDDPCVPINQVKPEVPGFFSGFMPVQADDATLPTYTIVINDTKPIWYYCSQGDHCQDGMVGVINPPAKNHSRTQESFAALAKNAPKNITPSGSLAGGSNSSSDSSASPGSGSSVTTGIPAPSGTSSGSASSGSNTTSPSSSAGVSAPPATFTGSANTLAIRRDILTGAGLSTILGLFVAFA
ncbi:hypothetical protein MMC07_008582 [Pseudocyphellaria aurata]|nr:hypothetical protein [Pseudocyphellaria aurata]